MDRHPACFTGSGRGAPGFEQAGDFQPFIQPHPLVDRGRLFFSHFQNKPLTAGHASAGQMKARRDFLFSEKAVKGRAGRFRFLKNPLYARVLQRFNGLISDFHDALRPAADYDDLGIKVQKFFHIAGA